MTQERRTRRRGRQKTGREKARKRARQRERRTERKEGREEEREEERRNERKDGRRKDRKKDRRKGRRGIEGQGSLLSHGAPGGRAEDCKDSLVRQSSTPNAMADEGDPSSSGFSYWGDVSPLANSSVG